HPPRFDPATTEQELAAEGSCNVAREIALPSRRARRCTALGRRFAHAGREHFGLTELVQLHQLLRLAQCRCRLVFAAGAGQRHALLDLAEDVVTVVHHCASDSSASNGVTMKSSTWLIVIPGTSAT